MGMRLENIEIDLWPFRWIYFNLHSVHMYILCRLYFPYITRQVKRTQYSINKKMKIVKRSKARVPERTSLHSFNLLWLMWAVCGGFFITSFILSNFVAILMKPVFEKPVDTANVTSNHRTKVFYWYFTICRMYMTETLRFLWLLVLKFGGKNWQSYLIHSLCWQKSITLRTLMKS